MVVAITAMLLVRRQAPEGSYFEDGDRAAGVFGVLATGFAVLLGFVVFLAFESFDTSRSGSETEAQRVRGAVRDGPALPVGARARLAGEASSATRVRWYTASGRRCRLAPLGTPSIPGPPRCSASARRWSHAQPPSTGGLHGKWLDQRTDREDARADRTHGAQGVIPLPLWIVLFLSAVVIFVFMLFFADTGERAVVQATMDGGVAIVITSTLLLVVLLDHPFHSGPGGLRPVAMERTIHILDQGGSRQQ